MLVQQRPRPDSEQPAQSRAGPVPAGRAPGVQVKNRRHLLCQVPAHRGQHTEHLVTLEPGLQGAVRPKAAVHVSTAVYSGSVPNPHAGGRAVLDAQRDWLGLLPVLVLDPRLPGHPGPHPPGQHGRAGSLALGGELPGPASSLFMHVTAAAKTQHLSPRVSVTQNVDAEVPSRFLLQQLSCRYMSGE